jgi:hypothetical protein
MAYDYQAGKDYTTEGTGVTYRIPDYVDTADAVVAFTDFAESIPFSEYVEVVNTSVGLTVDASYNGKLIVSRASLTLNFPADLPDGFSVAVTSLAGSTNFMGVDKDGVVLTPGFSASVVTVDGDNIILVADGSGGGGNTGAVWAIDVPSASDLSLLAESYTAARVNNSDIWARCGDKWIDACASQIAADGAPPAPVLVNRTENLIKFSPDGEGSAGETYAHGGYVTPASANLEFDQDKYEVIVRNTTPGVEYTVEIFGINAAGVGSRLEVPPFTVDFNYATGGSNVFEKTNYSGSGKTYRVHEFTSSQDFHLLAGSQGCNVLVVGRGGNGGAWNQSSQRGGGGGGGGGFVENYDHMIEEGVHPVSVNSGASTFYGMSANPGDGGAGGGSGGGGTGGASGAPTRNGGGQIVGAWGGCGGGGSGGGGQNTTGDGSDSGYFGSAGGVGRQSSINGDSKTYGAGGNGGGHNNSGAAGRGYWNSQSGCVIIAYPISMSTSREIEVSEAEEFARSEGFTYGKEEGIVEGSQQGKADLYGSLINAEMLTLPETDGEE